jgi:lysophospholipase L1-like esterase
MTHRSRATLRFGLFGMLGVCVGGVGCMSGDDEDHLLHEADSGATGGHAGSVGTGGATDTGAGGSSGRGGAAGAGGASSAGGRSGSGGTSRTGGRSGTGGTLSTGGRTGSGGTPGAGGATPLGDAGPAPDATAGPETGGVGPDGGEAGVRLLGRFDVTDATKPGFSWSGSGMLARFQGTGASLRIDGSPNFFTVVVDGTVAAQVLKVTSGTTKYTLATGLPAGEHAIEVWKRTEGTQGDNRFLGIDVTDGQLLAPVAAPDRRIEIYGDSISAGYGLDGKGPNCSWSADTENHYLTYGALTARELGADLHTIAWSGIGMYRNYGEAGPSSENMPAVYARILASKSSPTWDFSTWQPHAVIINLGTNDASTSGDPGTPYRTNYLEFVRTLRDKYPDTFFVLTIGPMLDGSALAAIKGHIQAVIQTRGSEGDSKMSFLEFPVQSQDDGLGCDWHPSAKTNAKMAALLVAELKQRLGW